MSTVKFNEWQNPDGTENYKSRAWVNFNGTGTVAIRASGNVASITDNGTGNYTVNFATAMPDANYAMTSSAGGGATSRNINLFVDSESALPTATAIRVLLRNENNADMDGSFVLLSFFR